MKKLAISFLTIFIALMITLLHGCGLPQDVKKFALKEANGYSKVWVFDEGKNCYGYKIVSHKTFEVSRAERTNGIDKHWLVDLEYICCDAKQCYDRKIGVNVNRKNGQMELRNFL